MALNGDYGYQGVLILYVDCKTILLMDDYKNKYLENGG